jgi:hypothetical protein
MREITTVNTPPIIIIGMHRSGTTMLARQLEALGLFMGSKKESNYESTFFLNINRWLMIQTGGAWDNPQAIHYLLENQPARRKIGAYIERYLLRTPRVSAFLGLGKYLRYRSLFNLDIPWGWKCPLNTFTLPVWLDLFPNAKVIHIYRHGVDVAQSLKKRGERDGAPERFEGLYYRWPILHAIRPKVGEFVRVRCNTLEGGLSLWEEYFTEAHSHVLAMAKQALELRYEDYLDQPRQAVKEIAHFCNVAASDDTIEAVADLVKKERAYAFRETPDLLAFANRCAQRLHQFGY